MNKTQLILVVVFVVTSGFAFEGCAILFNDKNETVRFHSEPPGAQVLVNGSPVGRTPTQAKLASDETYNIVFKKKGFEDTSVMLSGHVGAGWVILDFIFAVIPLILDAATESWYEFDQNHIGVHLMQPSNTTQSAR